MFEMEAMDLDSVPMDKVFETLRCDTNGLSTKAAEQRLGIFGPNKFEEEQESKIEKFFGFMWNPLSWAMEATAIMALVLANGGGKPTDWQDFIGIIVLLIINSTIGLIKTKKAGIVANALMTHLAPKTTVLRDGEWVKEDASILVPGDIIRIMAVDIIPADCRLLEGGDPLKIDQSALTGEYFPVTKRSGDIVCYGSTCKQGEIEAVVIATGVHTFFGNVNVMRPNQSLDPGFQKALTAVGNFCMMNVELIITYPILQRGYRVGVDNLLVLLIGGIPIAMPTVFSAIMATGSHWLYQQGAIIQRMTAIEKMAGMDVLFINRTGTLTLNKLSVDRNLIEVFVESVEPDDVVLMAARASRVENQDAIDVVVVGMLEDPKEARAGIQEIHFLPFNRKDWRTALTYIDNEGKMHRVSKGDPEQVN